MNETPIGQQTTARPTGDAGLPACGGVQVTIIAVWGYQGSPRFAGPVSCEGPNRSCPRGYRLSGRALLRNACAPRRRGRNNTERRVRGARSRTTPYGEQAANRHVAKPLASASEKALAPSPVDCPTSSRSSTRCGCSICDTHASTGHANPSRSPSPGLGT